MGGWEFQEKDRVKGTDSNASSELGGEMKGSAPTLPPSILFKEEDAEPFWCLHFSFLDPLTKMELEEVRCFVYFGVQSIMVGKAQL